MSNKLTLNSMKFEGISGVPTFGYTIGDDYGKDYYDLEETFIEDDVLILNVAIANSPEFFEHIKEMQKGLEINGIWYDYNEIESYLGD